ncbi:MAG: hypothetical protein BWY96_03031 [Spirochaetes bacterium ADurb.BinA120]|nr:MAG: hypothetical protein BWY96_03031 [Spirochaetes bacterium ADurb.BinA120]
MTFEKLSFPYFFSRKSTNSPPYRYGVCPMGQGRGKCEAEEMDIKRSSANVERITISV